jgi:hypothetical protein
MQVRDSLQRALEVRLQASIDVRQELGDVRVNGFSLPQLH